MANYNPVTTASDWRDTETGRFVSQLADDQYTPETVEKAAKGVHLYAQGMNIREICKELHCSIATLYAVWCSENPEYQPIVTAYQRARKRRAVANADSVTDIADDNSGDIATLPDGKCVINNANVQRDRARIDARLRLAAAYDPATYAPASAKLDININVEITDRINKALERVGSVIDAGPVDKSVDK